MKTGSLRAFVLILGGAAWLGACSSSDKKPNPASPEAGSGGDSNTGGKASGGTASGGKSAGGAGGATGGTSGGDGSAGASGSNSGGTDGGTGDAGDGGLSCVFPRCRPKYPTVLFPAENPYSDDKAMLGKILFWEEQIGQLDSMACGTCHRGASGGSDPRTNDPGAKLKGPDGIAQTQPDILSDDLRVAQGVPHCDLSGVTTDPTVQTTGRKPPTYFDAMFATQIFWDGRAGYCKNAEASGGCFYDPDMLALNANAAPLIKGVLDIPSGLTVGAALEAQASGPPASSVEMACAGRTWAAIEAKLQNTALVPLAKTRSRIPLAMNQFILAHGSNYPRMFKDVYGSDAKYKVKPADADDIINARRIVFAIATHERRLTSDQTPWDLWNDGTAAHENAMTPAQINGFTLFMGKAKCGSCHSPPLFTDNGFHNIGFHKPAWDPGRKAITNTDADATKFKTPTLRNVGLREPFGLLHDGDGPGHSLDTVMQLYNLGGQRSDPEIAGVVVGGIDPIMTGPLGLTAPEITDILDFLRNGLTDPRVKTEAAPFDRPKLGTEP